MARRSKRISLEAEIARLGDLGPAELRARWGQLYGGPAPKYFRRDFLVRALAYQMQVKLYGGLSEATKRRLREIAEAARDGTLMRPTLSRGSGRAPSWSGPGRRRPTR